MPATHEVFDQGPSRRKVEDVVLHDPCRHDHDRLRKYLLGGRKVLDQFNQAILVDNLPWGRRKVFADLVLFCPDRRLAQCKTLPILDRVLCQWRRQIVPNGGKKVYQSGLREKGFEAPIYLCDLMAVTSLPCRWSLRSRRELPSLNWFKTT